MQLVFKSLLTYLWVYFTFIILSHNYRLKRAYIEITLAGPQKAFSAVTPQTRTDVDKTHSISEERQWRYHTKNLWEIAPGVPPSSAKICFSGKE